MNYEAHYSRNFKFEAEMKIDKNNLGRKQREREKIKEETALRKIDLLYHANRN